MNDQILFAYRRKGVAGMLADAFGKSGIVGCEAEIVARRLGDFRERVERQQAGQNGDTVFLHIGFVNDEFAQALRQFGIELDADHRAAAAALERAFKQPDQILGLFLHLDIGIANDPERAGSADFVAGIERTDEQAHHVFKRDVADGAIKIRQTDKAVERHRQTDQRGHRLVGGLGGQLQADRKPQIGDERERMGRIDRQRRQHREDRLQELFLEPGHVGVDQRRRANDVDALLGQVLLQDRQRRLLLKLKPVDFLKNLVELLVRRQAVGRAVGDAFAHLPLKACDADHEELVEIGGRDRQEPHPLEQRMADIEGFIKNAAVELQPGEFTVDEAFRAVEQIDFRRCSVDRIDPHPVHFHALELFHHKLQRPASSCHRL